MKKIKIGQIGVCHEHASGKMYTMKLRPDLFEIVGVADDRASTAAKFAGTDLKPYDGLPLMSEEELFRIPGLEAVTVEVPNLDLVPTAMRCLERNLPIHMIEQQGGVIINLGSIDGVTGGAVVYGAAKAGMIGLTKSLALYGAPYNVRACCVSPGPVLTRPGMANMATPLKRAAEPIEVVNLILYLCSDKAAFITGSNYLIDGGRACGGASYITKE